MNNLKTIALQNIASKITDDLNIRRNFCNFFKEQIENNIKTNDLAYELALYKINEEPLIIAAANEECWEVVNLLARKIKHIKGALAKLSQGKIGNQSTLLLFLIKSLEKVKNPGDAAIIYDIINILLDDGAPVNYNLPYPQPLIEAITNLDSNDKRNQKLISRLIQKGAPVNTSRPGSLIDFPLSWAVALKKHQFIDTLLENGANINFPYGNLSPLANAVENKDITMIYYLLNKGADIHSSYDSDNWKEYDITDDRVQKILQVAWDKKDNHKI